MAEQRRFYVEAAYGLTGAEMADVQRFKRGGEVEDDILDGPAIITYDTGLGSVVVGMTLVAEVHSARDQYTVTGDAMWALGEALDVGQDLVHAFMDNKGFGEDIRVSPAHSVRLTHPDGLLEAMRTGAQGLAARELPDSHDSGEGAAA